MNVIDTEATVYYWETQHVGGAQAANHSSLVEKVTLEQSLVVRVIVSPSIANDPSL